MAKIKKINLLLVCCALMITVCNQIHADSQLNTQQAILIKAKNYENQGQWGKANLAYQQLLSKNPKNIQILIKLFYINKLHLKNWPKAITFLEKAIAQNPQAAELYVLLAKTYAEQKKPQQALLAMEKASKLDSKNNTYFHYQLQLANWAKNKPAIERTIHYILILEPHNKQALLQKASINNEKQHFSQSIAIYQQLLTQSPKDEKVLTSLMQVYTWNGNYNQAIKVLNKLNTLFPKKRQQWQTYRAWLLAMQGKGKQALKILQPLLSASPKDTWLLSIKKLANHKLNMQDKLDKANSILTYSKKDLEIDKRKQALLVVAYQNAHNGRWDQAIDEYQYILSLYPTEKAALIMLATVESWTGDYRAAIKSLETYKAYYGQNSEYISTKARVLAEAGYGFKALSVIKPLISANMNNINYLYTQTIAFHYSNQPTRAMLTLAQLNHHADKQKEILGLNAFIHTPLRDNLSVNGFHSYDRDTIGIDRAYVAGQHLLSPSTRLLFYGETERLHANRNSGLNPIEGNENIRYSRAMIGLNHIVNPHFSFRALIGPGFARNESNLLIYDINANIKVNDQANFSILESHQMYDVSPRAVSLNIKRQLTEVNMTFEPTLQRYIFSRVRYGAFSDGNSMWQYELNPMVAMYRSQYWQINGGIYANWQSFAHKPGNGYYTPRLYQFYGAMIHIYYAINSNVGYTLSATIGPQKDETFETFKIGEDFSFKAVFGIYQSYQFIFSTDFSNRGRGIANNASSGSYNVYSIGVQLTKRF